MMRALSTLLSLLLVCFFPLQAAAEQPEVVVPVIPPVPPGPDVHQFLPKGQPAPQDGYLFDGPTATRWGNWLILWKERYRIDMQKEMQVCEARTTLKDDQLKIEQQKNAAVLASYREQLESERKKNDQPWYRSFEFGVAMGVASTAVLVVVTGYALRHVD